MKQRIHLATALALLSTLALACAAPNDSGVPTAQGSDDIVSVPLTDVERQAIGNCWIYAHASWVESMHRTATGESFDVSQSYWSYWHWFEQIANGVATTISTGGNWKTANSIARKYGIVAKRDFIPSDGVMEVSPRRAPALAAINESLTRGALATPSGRRDKAVVRRELDRAWGLTPEVSAMLDGVFGAEVSRTFSSTTSSSDVVGPVQRVQDFKVAYTTAPGNRAVQRNLSQAMTEWRQAFYPANDRRGFQLRVQKALQDAQPVIVTWFVDFNALEGRDNGRLGSFNLTTLNELGPGGQGGHMTVLQDYEARFSDGRILAAGRTLDPTNPEDRTLLDTALLASTQIDFLRVKNAWGAARPDRAFATGMPGYNDLHFDYLDGPVKKCVERDGATDTTNCPTTITPLQDVVLPPGY